MVVQAGKEVCVSVLVNEISYLVLFNRYPLTSINPCWLVHVSC